MTGMSRALFRVLREGLGLSQLELAGRFGVQKRAVQRWEAGDREIPSLRAEQLLDLLEEFEGVVVDHVARATAGPGPLVLGILDDEEEMPPGWQRAVAFAVVRAAPAGSVLVVDATSSQSPIS